MATVSRQHRRICNLAQRQRIFREEAYFFVLEALGKAVEGETSSRDLSGQELLVWIRELGNERFGVMAGDVFNAWGVHSTLDFGRIVFHLVQEGLLSKRDRDSLSDFIDRFDFQEAFALKFHEGEA